MTTTAALPAATQLDMVRSEVTRGLAHTEQRMTETVGQPTWPHWAGQAFAYRDVLRLMDALAS